MTTMTPRPELREQHRHREYTHADWIAEGKARFGASGLDWAFICPNCGDVATARDFPDQERERIGQECVGRHRGALEGEPGPHGRGHATRGCNWAAYGLIPGPVAVTMPDGTVVRMFAFAPAPQPPQSAAQILGALQGPERAENPPAPPCAPPRALRVERRTPGKRQEVRGGPGILDTETWDYRVSLTDDQAVLGYSSPGGLTVVLADAAAWQLDFFCDLTGGDDRITAHLAKYELPFSLVHVDAARDLIRQAHASDALQPDVEDGVDA
jgi:hypothetical protein